MTRLRTFIAVDPGKAIRDRLVTLQSELAEGGPEVKWVEPENLHVTLLFLGEVDARQVPEVCASVAEVCSTLPAFAMSLTAVGGFPNTRRPRVLWVGIGEGAAELVALHDALEPPLLKLRCYRREERRYTPHVTLGRIRRERPDDRLGTVLGRYANWRGGNTQVTEVLVLSSELTRQGPVYTVLSRARLA
jgi:2'-5' RNA ligase